MPTTTEVYDIGDKPIVTATFEDIEGGTGVSTAVTFTIRDPAGDETEYTNADDEVEADGDNVWVLTMPRLDQHKDWHIRAESTAGLQAAVEKTIHVRKSSITSP